MKCLPLTPRFASSATKAAEPKTAVDSETAHLRILAAEDNETNRLVLKTLLAQASVALVFAVNGADAVEAWERQAWDAILMDIQMPEMDGLEAMRLIRERMGPRAPYLVALTAEALEGDRERFLAAGFDNYLSKPLPASDISEHISTAGGQLLRGALALGAVQLQVEGELTPAIP